MDRTELTVSFWNSPGVQNWEGLRGCVLRLVWGLVRCIEPCGEAGPCFVAEKLHGGEFAVRLIFPEFSVEECIVETCVGGIGVAGAIVDDVEAGPVAGGEAHGTGLATGVEFAALECKSAKGFACGTNGVDLAVGGGIVRRSDGVDAFADDAAVANDDGRKRAAGAGARIFSGEHDGAAQELWIGLSSRCQLAHNLPEGRK